MKNHILICNDPHGDRNENRGIGLKEMINRDPDFTADLYDGRNADGLPIKGVESVGRDIIQLFNAHCSMGLIMDLLWPQNNLPVVNPKTNEPAKPDDFGLRVLEFMIYQGGEILAERLRRHAVIRIWTRFADVHLNDYQMQQRLEALDLGNCRILGQFTTLHALVAAEFGCKIPEY